MSLKTTIKTAIAAGWDAGARLGRQRPKLTILYYHAVPSTRATEFASQMAYLSRVANIVDPGWTGPLATDRPNVAVTFDDAFRSVREHALPALVRYNVAATIYVPTGWLGRSPGWTMESAGDRDEVVMTADELRSLPPELIAFGSHTIDHPQLTTLSDAEVGRQLTQSRVMLAEVLDRPVDTLAFPYGDHDQRIIELARAAGYCRVYTVAPQAIHEGDSDISRGRTSADPADSASVFALKVRGAFDWMPIASRLKRRLTFRS